MLNNKGWGLSTLVICLAVILFFLLISFVSAINFNNKIESENKNETNSGDQIIDNEYYINLEKNMDQAAIKYINSNISDFENNETIMISAKRFIEYGYLENMIDLISKNECNGYSIIKNYNGTYKVTSYINCDNYKTDGYGD